MHTPESATRQFVRELGRSAARAQGDRAFEQTRRALHLGQGQRTNHHMSARWAREKDRIALVSSNVLVDEPGRFDLRVSWYPPRDLRAGLLERLLGAPMGVSATGDQAWLLDGGVLEYRTTATETPYLLFSSPGYIRDPLDFVEAVGMPRLPEPAAVDARLKSSATAESPERSEEAGIRSQRFCRANGVCVTRYAGAGPQSTAYLAGLSIVLPSEAAAPDFLPILRELSVPDADEAVGAVAGDGDRFGVYRNFALALRHSNTETTLAIWRRIETPREWCGRLRPDLERCIAP